MSNLKPEGLQIHPHDNVRVLLQPNESVPFGHKIAGVDIAAQTPVIKYGQVIGLASQNIRAGEWVHTHNLKSALSEHLHADDTLVSRPPETHAAASQETFAAYQRENGRVGIRNDIFILPTVGCVNATANKLMAYGRQKAEAMPQIDSVTALTHPLGCSQLGDDHVATKKILQSLARHGNAGGTLILGLGCENNQVDAFRQDFSPAERKRIRFLECQAVQDELAAGRRLIDELLEQAAAMKRQPCPLSSLIVGLKCGGSDAFSGLTANPLLGRFSQWLISRGGSCIMTEIPEFFGAEQVLLPRCENADVYQRLHDLLQSFRDEYSRHGLPVYENPSPGNQEGGLTTLEEKALGCVQKAGNTTVRDVIAYGETVRKSGLTVLEGPGNDLISCTALAAAGAHLILFTTGRGTPWGGPVPTLKISSQQELWQRKRHWLDFDASPALTGPGAIADLDKNFIGTIQSVIGGKWTQNEKNDYREIALFKRGVTL